MKKEVTVPVADRGKWGGFETVNFSMQVVLLLFGVLLVVGIIADIYPAWSDASVAIDKEVDAAIGTYKSSTCMFYRNELSESQLKDFGESARMEGDSRCTEANVVLKRNRFVMKVNRFVYHYLPWAPGNAVSVFKDLIVYFTAITPVVTILFRALYPFLGAGQVVAYARDAMA